MPLDHQACRECLDPRGRRERAAMLDHWALQDNTVPEVLWDPLAQRVLRGCLVESASLV